MAQAVSWCEDLIQSRGFAQHVAINAAKLVALQDNPRLREIVAGCELVTADGQSVVWASRLLGDPVPCRVAGIDLMDELLARAASKGYGVYILGARREVLERAVSRLRAQHPGLRIVGHGDGYFPRERDAEVAAEIRRARPDMLFVAITSPRKEYFLAAHGRQLGVPFVMGVGGAIDVVAGDTRRAPRWLQRLGLEWLFRLQQEPGRLMRRYALTNTRFVALLVRELVQRRIRPRALIVRRANGSRRGPF